MVARCHHKGTSPGATLIGRFARARGTEALGLSTDRLSIRPSGPSSPSVQSVLSLFFKTFRIFLLCVEF